MARLGPSTDYTDKDFDALRARLMNLIASAFPEWTDDDVADFGNILVDLFCFVGDVITKYQDNQAAEAFWGRVTQRKNILGLCKQIGFVPRGNTASSVDLVLTCTPAPAGTLTIPERTRAKTDEISNPVVFETLGAVTFSPGESGPRTITAENATLRTERFTSTGRPNQEFELAGTPYLDNSLVIVAGDGVYTQVTDFLDSTSTSRDFTVSVNQDDRARFRFGNGINGTNPTGTITAQYKTGGGSAGRVEAGAVRRLEGSFVDSLGNTIAVSVTNPSPSTLPLDRQTVEEIRVAGPRSLRALTRTVAREDYEINALRVPGIGRALMLTSDQDPSVPENTGFLYVIPKGGGTATQAMKDAVLQMVTVTYPSTLTFVVDVRDAVFLTVNIRATVYLRASATPANRAAARAAILAALTKAFDPDTAPEVSTDTEGSITIDFGYNIRDENGNASGVIAWSDILDIIRDVPSIRKVDSDMTLNGLDSDLPIEQRQFPVLGTVTLIEGTSGTPL